METRKLGNSDLNITPVGFGAWAIGGAGWEFAWGPQEDQDSIAAIHRALELGVNWIDTAAVLGTLWRNSRKREWSAGLACRTLSWRKWSAPGKLRRSPRCSRRIR